MSLRGGSPGAPWVFTLGAAIGSLATIAWISIGGEIQLMERWSSEYDDLAHYREVRDFISERYVGESDPDALVRVALSSMVESLDEYSRYYHTTDALDGFQRETRGSFAGIGIVFMNSAEPGPIRVLFPCEGSAAELAGVRVGDLIVSVDGESLEGLTRSEARSSFLGEVGTEVSLGIVGLDGEERALTVTREERTDPSVRHPHFVDEELKIAYLAITSFTTETPAEFGFAMKALGEVGMQGLVLDLRGNPGGILKSAVEIAEHFVPAGVITQTRGRDEPVLYERDALSERETLALPLVVLVDGGSASSSEVLAGALQDHRVAVLVGSPTYGKARVQSVRHFVEAGALAKVTSSYYQTPSGRDLDRSDERPWGIKPDVEVKVDRAAEGRIHRHINRYDPPAEALKALFAWEDSTDEAILPEDPEDPQLEAAIALLRGASSAGN